MLEELLITLCLVVGLGVLAIFVFFFCSRDPCCMNKRQQRQQRHMTSAPAVPDVAVISDEQGNMIVVSGLREGAPGELQWKPPDYIHVSSLPTYDEATSPQEDPEVEADGSGMPLQTIPSTSFNADSPDYDKDANSATDQSQGVDNPGYMDDTCNTTNGDMSRSNNDNNDTSNQDPGNITESVTVQVETAQVYSSQASLTDDSHFTSLQNGTQNSSYVTSCHVITLDTSSVHHSPDGSNGHHSPGGSGGYHSPGGSSMSSTRSRNMSMRIGSVDSSTRDLTSVDVD